MAEDWEVIPLEILDLILDEVEAMSTEYRAALALFPDMNRTPEINPYWDPYGSPLAKLRYTNRLISDRVRYRMWRDVRLYFADNPGYLAPQHFVYYYKRTVSRLLALLDDATFQPPLASVIKKFTCITFLHSDPPQVTAEFVGDLFSVMAKLAATPTHALQEIHFDNWHQWPGLSGQLPHLLAAMISNIPETRTLMLQLTGFENIPISTFKGFNMENLILKNVTLSQQLPKILMDTSRLENLSVDDTSYHHFSLLIKSEHLRHLTIRFNREILPSEVLGELTSSNIRSLTLELNNKISQSPKWYTGLFKRFPRIECIEIRFISSSPNISTSPGFSLPPPYLMPIPLNMAAFQGLASTIKSSMTSIHNSAPGSLYRLNFNFRIYSTSISYWLDEFMFVTHQIWMGLDHLITQGVQSLPGLKKVSVGFSFVFRQPLAGDRFMACKDLIDDLKTNMRRLFPTLNNTGLLENINIQHERDPIYLRPLKYLSGEMSSERSFSHIALM